jgi:hypothetical protein
VRAATAKNICRQNARFPTPYDLSSDCVRSQHRPPTSPFLTPKVPLFENLADILEGKRQLMASEALFQHDISQFYLRGFTSSHRPSEKSWIWRLDKETGECARRRIGRICGSKQRRTLRAADAYGAAADAWLGVVETHASKSLRRLANLKTGIRESDRLTIAFYLALQSTRTPPVSPLPSQDVCLLANYRERRSLVSSEHSPQSQAFESMLMASGARAHALASMSWTFLHSEEMLVFSDRLLTYVPAPALKTKQPASLFVPLTPHTALHLRKTSTPQPFALADLSAAEATELNGRALACAQQYVFAKTCAALECLGPRSGQSADM